MKIPYERVIAWLAGPLSIAAGYLATQLTTHVGLFGSLGVTKDQTARAIVTVGTFAIGAACTYLAHAKWLSNLTAWWATQQKAAALEPPPTPSFLPSVQTSSADAASFATPVAWHDNPSAKETAHEPPSPDPGPDDTDRWHASPHHLAPGDS